MDKALLFTAYNRPQYLRETLESWQKVRGVEDWPIYFMVEPSEVQENVLEVISEFDHPQKLVSVNPRLYGVLHCPWVGFERLFRQYEFVVRAEDDLVVSDDILEYFGWAAEYFEPEPDVATVHGYTEEQGDEYGYRLTDGFGPWLWGTWRDRWQSIIGPTWDHDYSTYNHAPGNEAGWDWNLNTRIFPEHNLHSITPTQSRVHNIGVVGTHAVAEQYITSPSFLQHRNSGQYHKVR